MADEKSGKLKELWTFIKFSIAGVAATLVEMGVHLVLDSYAFKSMNNQPFHAFKIGSSFVFDYPGNGISGKGTMIAFIISTIVGYAIAYVLNRKVTFKANNNVVKSTIIYILMVAFIVCFQSWGGPLCKEMINGWGIQNDFILGLLPKTIMCIICTLISYPLNRFVIQKKEDK